MPDIPATTGPSAESMVSIGMQPSTRFRMMPSTSQVMRVETRSQPLRIMMTMRTGRTSSTRDFAVEPSSTISLAPPALILRPKMMNSTAEIAADSAAYGKRVRTTSESSASCVSAEEIVVSEIGARLSPKIAPLMMAPHMRPTFISSAYAIGTSTGATAATEPVEVPQEVEMSMQTTKPISGRKPVFRPALETAQISASMMPLWRMSCASTPARIYAMMMVPSMLFVRPLSVTEPKCFLSLQRKKPRARQTNAMRTTRLSPPVCVAVLMIIRMIIVIIGIQGPMVPP